MPETVSITEICRNFFYITSLRTSCVDNVSEQYQESTTYAIKWSYRNVNPMVTNPDKNLVKVQ